MDIKTLTTKALEGKTVAIIGYGNQGRAQAQNLRDSGVKVVIGSRVGAGFDQATADGFAPRNWELAAKASDVVMFLLPDQVIPQAHAELKPFLKGKHIGFSHGFAIVFGGLVREPEAGYFLVGPKGAGAILRREFVSGQGLPGVFAVESTLSETRAICLSSLPN